ncbi:hypothetical protein [Pontibacter ruber]|uniref:GAF domain-containing protein n=1 Tax=Pontibacter ruber TaxID=1343895 RepID=A0ABW5CYZ2_9BACT|nr:hypothetical protein [Pontibacter ruber]
MRKILHAVIDWLFDKSGYISGAAVLVLTIIDISNVNEWTYNLFGSEKFQIGRIFYYIVIIIAFIFGIISISHAKNISALEKDVQEKGEKISDLETTLSEIVNETNELFNSYLKLLVKNLDFTHQERISVYKVYENHFVLIGRSSINPNLMEKGRPKYPIKEGFIGKGWAEGEYFVDDLPDPTLKNGDTYYNRVNRISPIDRNTHNYLNMRSRTFFVYRINGFDNNPKAVLVFESEREKAFLKDNIIESLAGVKQPLVMFIEKNNGVKLLNNKELDI